MNLTVIKRFEFEYAHYLPGYEGPCANLHGHRAELEVGVSGVVGAKTGMVIDFKTLKAVVKQEVVDKLDHSCLNDLDLKDFPSNCPTAENTLLWMVSVLRPALWPVELTVVRLWETSGSYCEWKADASL